MSILTVGEATKHIKEIFDKDVILSSVFIRGEISNFKKHHSGHCYFTLKDSEATIRAVMFRSRAQYLKFVPRDGQNVVAAGNISVYERDGQYQLYADQLIPDGIGELSLAYEALKEKLSAEGLFDLERKKVLPILPEKVGLITSPTGAALRDIRTVAKRRHPGVALLLLPVQVQGLEAPPQIAKAIETFNELSNVDVIIVGLGGGSIEELWAFNDERVVRAIAASRIPIVSAVGHETDFTLADFAADRRAATPSQAAELAVPDVKELRRYLLLQVEVLNAAIRRYIDIRRKKVEQFRESRIMNRPVDQLFAKQQLLDIMINRLQTAEQQQLQQKRHLFEISAQKLSALSPLSVFSRGYSIVRTPDGRIISDIKNTTVGDFVELVLNRGALRATVTEVEEENNVTQNSERKP